MSWEFEKLGKFESDKEAADYARRRRIDDRDFDTRGGELWVRRGSDRDEKPYDRPQW